MCYRVEVDTATEEIKFFMYFTKEVVEAPIRSVEFVLSYRWAWLFFVGRVANRVRWLSNLEDRLGPRSSKLGTTFRRNIGDDLRRCSCLPCDK